MKNVCCMALCGILTVSLAENGKTTFVTPKMNEKLSLVKEYEEKLPEDSLSGKPLKAEVRKVDGIPRLFINGKIELAMGMIPDPRVPFDQAALSVKDFSAAGIRVFSNILWERPNERLSDRWWIGESKYDFRIIDNMVNSILKVNPDALFFPRLKLEPQPWWHKSNPEDMTRLANGEKNSFVSMASKKWTLLYECMMRDIISHMEKASYGSHILGYHVAAGSGGEWIYPRSAHGSNGDYSPVAQKEFQDFLRRKYGDDPEKLRYLLNKPDFSFETAEIPVNWLYSKGNSLILRQLHGDELLVMEYRNFLIQEVNRNHIHSMKLTRELTKGKKLIGSFGGLSGRLPFLVSGFNGLSEVLWNAPVSFWATPAVYYDRGPGATGSYQAPCTASFRLHGALYYDEVDIRSCFFKTKAKLSYHAKNLDETINQMKRQFGWSLTNDCDLWWFLLAGNNTFHHEQLMNLVAKMAEVSRAALTLPAKRNTEVAVFTSDVGGGWIRWDKNVVIAHEHILPRLGIPCDRYYLEDIVHPELPDYKVYIFLNAYYLTPDMQNAIEQKVKRKGKTALWFFAPGYIQQNGTRSTTAVSKLTGICLKAEESAKSKKIKAQHGELFETTLRFFIQDPEVEILGKTEDGAILGRKCKNGFTSIYSMLPLSVFQWRKLLGESGVHVYMDTSDVFNANDRFLMVCASKKGKKEIRLPGTFMVKEIFRDKDYSAPTNQVIEDFALGETRIYSIKKINSKKDSK